MKLGAVGAALFVTCCLGNAAAPASADERACSVKNCFFAGDVREFEVIDRTTLIVYTGSRRCAFKVELRGAACDMSYAPELVFNDPYELPQGQPNLRSRLPGGFRLPPEFDDLSTATQQLGRSTLRVCDNDLRLQVSGGLFTDRSLSTQSPLSGALPSRGPGFPNRRADCQLQSVSALTDDQVVEVYVAHNRAPPPPPMGSARLDVGNSPDDASIDPARNPPDGAQEDQD